MCVKCFRLVTEKELVEIRIYYYTCDGMLKLFLEALKKSVLVQLPPTRQNIILHKNVVKSYTLKCTRYRKRNRKMDTTTVEEAFDL